MKLRELKIHVKYENTKLPKLTPKLWMMEFHFWNSIIWILERGKTYQLKKWANLPIAKKKKLAEVDCLNTEDIP